MLPLITNKNRSVAFIIDVTTNLMERTLETETDFLKKWRIIMIQDLNVTVTE